MEGFDFSGSPDTNSQPSFDSQPLQNFDFEQSFSRENSGEPSIGSPNPGDYLSSLTSENQFSGNSSPSFSTDPNDFINASQSFSSDFSAPSGENASYPPSNFNDSYVPSPNFSVDPSDFIAPSEQPSSHTVDSFSYPPSIETPVDSFVAEPQPINDSFFNEPSPKSPAESKPASIYSSLSDNDNSSRIIVEKNQILRDYEFEHEKFLQERANEERKKHEETLSQAQNELKKFYAEREERTKKLKEENSEKSSSFGSNPPADDKQAWINLDNLLDWKSASKDAKDDTSRMRSILITLKH